MNARVADDVRTVPARWRRAGLGAIALLYAVSGLASVRGHVELNEEDTARYLRVALEIREGGGALSFPLQCIGGAYTEDNLQPLYMVALAPFAERDVSFFVRAKLVTWAMGLVALIVLYRVGLRTFGDGPALGACLLLAVNLTFVHHAGMVACEALVLIAFTAAWGDLGEALVSGRRALLGGLMVGVAYLTKGTGLFMLPAFAAAALLKYRRRALSRRWLWLVGAGFLIAASPLVVRNVRVYGSPFHNVNSAAIWVDEWEDTYKADFRANPPTFASYWRAHTLGEMGGRMVRGLYFEARMFVQRTLGFVGTGRLYAWGVGWLEVVPALLALGLLAAGIVGMARDHRGRGAFSALLLVGFYVFFAWYYAVGQGPRFMLPLAPVVYLYASDVLLRRMGSRRPSALKRLGPALAATALGLAAVAAVASPSFWRDLGLSYRLTPGFEELRDWLEENVGEGETYLLGPTNSFDFSWCSHVRGWGEDIPVLESFAALDRYVLAHRIRVLVLTKDAILRRKAIFRDVAVRSGRGTVLKLPAPWRRAAHTRTFEIYERAGGGGGP